MKKIILLSILSALISGCGSMSFGETALDTLFVFGEAYEIKTCYESGGTYDLCEGQY